MTQFRKMIGGGNEFRNSLENKLQNFHHGSDYITFHEVFGNVRRQHYVIFTSKAANSLREINWQKLKDFKSIEIGETNDPKVEDTIDNEAMKFIVETFGDEWVSDYQTTNPSEIPEEVRRQKIEIMIKQAQIELKDSSINYNHLKTRLKWAETEDISYEQLKSFINSSKHLEHLKPVDPSDSDVTYHYFESFDGDTGEREKKEWGSKPSNLSSSSSVSPNAKKYCSSCNAERPANTNFCQTCGQRLKVITDQEVQQYQQVFTKPPKGGN